MWENPDSQLKFSFGFQGKTRVQALLFHLDENPAKVRQNIGYARMPDFADIRRDMLNCISNLRNSNQEFSREYYSLSSGRRDNLNRRAL